MTAGRSRTELPPDGTSPGRARRLVEAVVAGTQLEAVLDEALLLVTELVTNSVVHAGTTVVLETTVDEGGLRVEVSDRGSGRLTMKDSPAEIREGGRGLFLLDALATQWGTRYGSGLTSVWFLLGSTGRHLEPTRPLAPSSARSDAAFLLGLPDDLEERVGPERLVGELLARVVEGLGCDRGWVVTAAGDAAAWSVLAAYDDAPRPDLAALRQGTATGCTVLPLRRAGGGTAGALVLATGGLTPDQQALARLVAERVGLVLRDEQARQSQMRTRGSLAVLAQAAEMFAGTLDVRLAVSLAAQLVVPSQATWSAVWTTYDHSPVLQAVAHADEARASALRVALSGTAGRQLLTMVTGRVVGDRPLLVSGGQLPASLGPDRFTEGALVLPLVARRRLLGLLLVAAGDRGSHTAEETGLLVDLARTAALAIDNARLYEERSSIAEALQASLLPPELPTGGAVQFGARYAAAGEGNEVGGDFYDVFALGQETWGFAIGDVCGKGAPAAAITGMARDVLRLLTREGAQPAHALQRLNEVLLELGERSRFCTAVLGTAARRGEHVVVRFSSAGHPAPAVVRADGSVGFVGASGTLLGVLPEVDVPDDEVTLQPGESLVFYTDGVTERRGRSDMFGEANLLRALRAAGRTSADELAGALESAVHLYGAGSAVARDDLAVLVVRAPVSVAGQRAGVGPAPDRRVLSP